MFKKPVKVQTQNLLKGSESKKVKEQILKAFPNITSEIFDEKLLSPKEKLIRVKLSGTHTTLYQETKDKGKENGEPLFIDLEGRGDLYPTVYALWRVPKLLKTFTVHGPVFQYIEGGADLMLPGVSQGGIEAPETLKKGDKIAVLLKGYNLPVAVGTCLVDSAYIQRMGMKGKGLESVHYFGDSIWALGSQSEPQMEKVKEGNESDDNETTEKSTESNNNNNDTTDGKEAVTDQTNAVNSNSGKEEEKGETSEKIQPQESPSFPPNPLRDDNDALLVYCLLNCLKYHFKKDTQFPILYNRFFSEMAQLPCRPLASTSLDIKKTKWKKVSAFMTEMKQKGLIVTEETSPGVFQVTSVNRIHPDYAAFKPNGFSPEELKENEALLNQGNENEPRDPAIEITELLKPPSGLLPLFLEQGGKKGDLYTVSTAREMLASYIAAHSLTSPEDKQKVLLDALLVANVVKKVPIGMAVPKKDLNEAFLSKMQSFYEIYQNGQSDVRKGSPEPIIITIENRQGGKKHVTHIAGLENFGISPEDSASEFNKQFAASTSVQQLPGKTAGKEVLVQGDVSKKVIEHFISKYHIAKKYFVIQEKGKKSK